MHSRIYQTSIQPIPEFDYIKESNYYDHWFTNSIADYVNGDTDRVEDIKWLKECYDGKGLEFGVDDGGEYFVIVDKMRFFEENFNTFQTTLRELMDASIDSFVSHKIDSLVYRLKSMYDDEFGFYVQDDNCGLCTLDYMIRSKAEGSKFYIGATIDYHF